MTQELQKASFWKRISAYILDLMVMAAVAVACGAALVGATHFKEHNQKIQVAYQRYETEYGISFELTEEEYLTMPEQQRQQFDLAYAALIADQEAMYAYNMTIYLSLGIVMVSILIAMILLEVIGPMFLGNCQTLGKKVFGLQVVRMDGSPVSTMPMLVRTMLGKYTIEIMIPVLMILLMFFNIIGAAGLFVAAGIVLLQAVLLGGSKNNLAIHDRLAGTVVVDDHVAERENYEEQV